MSKDQKLKRLQQESKRLDKDYGYQTGGLGSDEVKLNATSTGILGLDYALGTGGWPKGYVSEVFGPPDIGKSTIIGLNGIRCAQQAGNLCGIIAMEPNFDQAWAAKHGVDPELLAIARPDTGEKAFNILYDWVKDDLIDFIVFDSIGALLRGSEIETETGKSAKPGAGGQAALITWGIKRIVSPAWKNNKTIICLNQVRDVMSSTYSMLDSPGGHALKHSSSIRLQLKPGKNKYFDGDKILVGREIVGEVVRNKLTEGTRQRALFDFYQKETEDHPVGVDYVDDIIKTGKKTGVIQGTGWLSSSLWEGTIHGAPALAEKLREEPSLYDEIRDQVLRRMFDIEGIPDTLGPDDES